MDERFTPVTAREITDFGYVCAPAEPLPLVVVDTVVRRRLTWRERWRVLWGAFVTSEVTYLNEAPDLKRCSFDVRVR